MKRLHHVCIWFTFRLDFPAPVMENVIACYRTHVQGVLLKSTTTCSRLEPKTSELVDEDEGFRPNPHLTTYLIFLFML